MTNFPIQLCTKLLVCLSSNQSTYPNTRISAHTKSIAISLQNFDFCLQNTLLCPKNDIFGTACALLVITVCVVCTSSRTYVKHHAPKPKGSPSKNGFFPLRGYPPPPAPSHLGHSVGSVIKMFWSIELNDQYRWSVYKLNDWTTVLHSS